VKALRSVLQCDLSWIEALEAGETDVPAELATRMDTLARCHESAGVPTSFRGRGHDCSPQRHG
jgi:hypothetical protein